MQKDQKVSRGFTIQEKWVIWGVFCLLVGLSTSRVTVFMGMLLLSIGIFFFIQRRHKAAAAILCLFGLLNLAFSKFLI